MSIALKPYYAYKDSGVPWLGEVPAHWDIGPGFSMFREKKVKNTGMIESQVLSLSYGRIVIKPSEKLHGLVPASFETYQIVNPDDIIIRPTDLQNDWNSLRVGLARDRGIITSAYMCLRAVEPTVPEYGYLLLHAYDLKKIFYGMGSGLRQNLDFFDLKRMPVLIPPTEEQSAIARFLDHHDRLTRRYIRAQRRLIELLTEQKQALIQQAVTRGLDPDVPLKDSGIEWLGKIPAHWEIRRNSRIFLERNNPGRVDIPIMIVSLNSGVTIGEDIDDNGRPRRLIEERSNYKFAAKGDIAYNMMRMWQGAVGVVPTDGLVSPAYVVARPLAGTNPEYFVYLFRTGKYKNEINRNSHGIVSDRNRLYWDEFKNLVSLVPPVEEQDSIVEYIVSESTQIDRAIARAQRQIDLIREYRTRLIADVVTGKLDVRGVALSEESAVASDNLVDWIETEDLEDDVPDTEEPQEGIE